jgi:hypothetical protein
MTCLKSNWRLTILLNDSCSNWEVVFGTGQHINGTLGLLIRQHYPGMVTYAEVTSSPWTWEHFYTAEDSEFWVSLHRTKLVNTTHSLVILEIMK